MRPHLVECGLKGMREKRIGIRALKSRLSECVREVKSGRTIVVTEHGQPVARLIPEAVSPRERIEALRRAGTIAWSGKRLRPAKPAGKVRGNRTVADLIVENRE
jgi:prevent-host-death family protein